MAAEVFLFRADDGRGREERLKLAARYAGHGKSGGEETPGLWRIARTERGKPYFPEQGGLHFSISHSGEFWACAFSASPIGIDIQEHVRKKGEGGEEAAARYLRLAKRFFHPREAAWVGEDPESRFFQIWAAKESYVKYTGTGIGADFGRFCLVPEKSLLGWEAEGAWFYSREIFGEYTLCVCCREAEESVQIHYFDEKSDICANI